MENDLAEDTIVIITTDDGTAGYAAVNENDLPNENGFNMGQGVKVHLTRRTSFIFFVKWDGVLKANKEMSSLTTITDIYLPFWFMRY